MSEPNGSKWRLGVLEKVAATVIAALILGLGAWGWSAGATAVERLGQVPMHGLRLDNHDAEIKALKESREQEEQGRLELIRLLREAAARRRGERN